MGRKPNEIYKEIVNKYVEDFSVNGELVLSVRKLALLMYEKNKTVFKDSEAARFMLKAYLGKCGNNSKVDNIKVINPFSKTNQWNIPPAEMLEDTSPFIIPAMYSPALSLGDIHLPYHDEMALEASLEDGNKNNCKSVFLNGDAIDFYQISNFVQDPRKRSFNFEIEMLYSFLLTLSKNFDKVYWKIGNHEERYFNYLFKNAPLVLTSERFFKKIELESILDIESMGNVEIIKNKRPVKMGNLNVFHGHEWGKDMVFSPVNPARGYFLKALDHNLTAHKHQSSFHSQPTVTGKIIGSWSQGCLCQLNPQYAPFNKWNLGFTRVEFEDNGEFEVHNKTIKNGKVY
jgi:hypothetical protein